MTRSRRIACVSTVAALGLAALAATLSAAEPRTVPAAAQPAGVTGSAPDAALFTDRIAPLLGRRCLSCHSDAERRGGLSLETREGLLRGGESGPAIEPGDPAASYLLDLITPDAGQAAMPKDADPLTDDERADVRRWIEQGAAWPEGLRIEPPVVRDTAWWSLEPLAAPPLPVLPPAEAAWVRNPIDAFIAAGHTARGLRPAPEADRRTLLRRLTFDLTGLPPAPEELAAFEADPSPTAYEDRVERLLASTDYAERWARHWLDVVHYGETHGYDKDKPRPHAWPYRDYVIRAFAADKPYGRFVEEQIAGDVLYPGSRDGIEALGFLAAGPWDLIGHAEVPETKLDGQIARHLDRDDMVATTINTFCSLTVHCAQCHHHKFDPIPQEDYYALQAVFAAVDRADKPYDLDPATAQRRAALTSQAADLAARKASIEGRIRKAVGPELADVDRRLAEARRPAGPRPPEYGYHSALARRPDAVKWVQVDLGRPVALARIVLTGCHDDFNGIGAGFGFPRRYKLEAADDPEFRAGVRLLVDRSDAPQPNPGTAPQAFPVAGVTARYLRLTALELAPRKDDYMLALAELEALDAAGRNAAAGAPVTALDAIEAPVRWSKRNLTDGRTPGSSPARADALAALQAERDRLLSERAPADLRKELTAVEQDEARVRADLAALPPPALVYAATVHTGSGAFRGTGADGGRPRPIYVLHRGDVKKRGALAAPGALGAIAALDARFDLPADHAEGARRAALARWLSDPRNPLTWRSIVNRVWQYHLGRGLVETPNDFGRQGQPPSHPELLDWLAANFRDHGQSLKWLHRLIVTSATYRQASAWHPQVAEHARAVDPENRAWARMNRRRLEAEAVRDSLLAVAGKLDRTRFGPSFQDFVIERPEHSPHYEYHLHDPNDPRTHRRSIYRFVVRSQPQPWMAALDCADPSLLVDRRNETLTPLQALALLNNRLVLVMAGHFARRVEAEAGPDLARQVDRACALALGRRPSADERTALVELARQHGLENACRALLNLNEFVLID